MTDSPTRSVLIDFSQFVRWPHRSGIQRVLLELTRCWPGRVAARGGFRLSGRYYTLELDVIRKAIERVFREGAAVDARGAERMQQELTATARTEVFDSALPAPFSVFFLPEPTYDPGTLQTMVELKRRGTPVYALVMDALPATKPWLYPGRHHRETDRYFRVIADLDHVGFISSTAQRDVEERLRRSRVPDAIVAPLGGDGLRDVVLPPASEPADWFVIVGTIEPKKAVGIALDAFELLTAQGNPQQLVVIGAPAGDTAAISRLRASRAVTWLESCTDRELAIRVSRARACLFLGENEGFGIPPLEAMTLGCPVIAGRSVPSLEDLSDAGQIRLPSVTPESVADAVSRFADPATNATARAAVRRVPIPTWSDFARRVADWIGDGS